MRAVRNAVSPCSVTAKGGTRQPLAQRRMEALDLERLGQVPDIAHDKIARIDLPDQIGTLVDNRQCSSIGAVAQRRGAAFVEIGSR